MEFHFHTGHPEKLSYLLSLRPQFFCAAPGIFSLGGTPITTPRQEEDTVSDIFRSNSFAEKRSRRAALLLPTGMPCVPPRRPGSPSPRAAAPGAASRPLGTLGWDVAPVPLVPSLLGLRRVKFLFTASTAPKGSVY